MKYLRFRVFAKLSPHQKAWHIWQRRRKIMKNKLVTRVVAVKMQYWGYKQGGNRRLLWQHHNAKKVSTQHDDNMKCPNQVEAN